MLRTERERPISPPWKVRTRPCPFYSSGRCLFDKSCNFRHVIKSPLTPVESTVESKIIHTEYITEPYDFNNDGRHINSDDNSRQNLSRENRGLTYPSMVSHTTPPDTIYHSKEHSVSSVSTNTTSPTETGTVRARPISIDDIDQPVIGLGLTNIYPTNTDHIYRASPIDLASPLPLVSSKRNDIARSTVSVRADTRHFSDARSLESNKTSKTSQIEIVSPVPVQAVAFASSIDGSEVFRQMAPGIHPSSRTPSLEHHHISRESTLELDSPVQITSSLDKTTGLQTARSHQAFSLTPSLEAFVFPPQSAQHDSTPALTHLEQSHTINMSQSSSLSQVLVVNERKMNPSTAIQLAMPTASSLIISRAGKNDNDLGNSPPVPTKRISGEAGYHESIAETIQDPLETAPSINEDEDHQNLLASESQYSREHAYKISEFELPTAQPVVDLTSPNSQSVHDDGSRLNTHDTKDVSDTVPTPLEPSPLLETPPIDYENESPSRARQRFHRAFKLVTDELRQRVAHLRKPSLNEVVAAQENTAPLSPPIPSPPIRAVPFLTGQRNIMDDLVESQLSIERASSFLLELDRFSGSTSNSRKRIAPVNQHQTVLGDAVDITVSPGMSPVASSDSFKHFEAYKATTAEPPVRRGEEHSVLEMARRAVMDSPPAMSDHLIEEYSLSSELAIEYSGIAPEAVPYEQAPQQDDSYQDVPPSSRPWLKPFRLSTFGGPGTPTSARSTEPIISSSKRSFEISAPTSRAPSPSKRPPSSIIHHQESVGSKNDLLDSPVSLDQELISPYPEEFAPLNRLPSAPLSPAVQYVHQSGSSHIHSPSPTRWTSAKRGSNVQSDYRRASSLHTPGGRAMASPSPSVASRSSARPRSAMSSRPPVTPPLPINKPKLFFAIASSQPEEVARLLATGEASPNETVGPQDIHALAFALDSMNHGDPADLPKKEEIVTTLLSYGADPHAIGDTSKRVSTESTSAGNINPFVSYFLNKADRSPVPVVPHSTKQQASETMLQRAKFVLVGQEHGIQELVRAYSAHSRLARFTSEDDREMPFVVLLAGPSGHGKTLLASKVGSLLGISSYTINMTLSKGHQDLWTVPSCYTREASEYPTLRDFLSAHESKQAVVVVDEIEKVDDQSLLQSLLLPWERGLCRADSSPKSIDTSHIIWICTSNIGSSMIVDSVKEMDPGAFEDLSRRTRDCLRDVLGASLIARVSTVIPFYPFSLEEQRAVSSKCLSALQCNIALSNPDAISNAKWDGVIDRAVQDYVAAEGARSIRRSIIRWADAAIGGI